MTASGAAALDVRVARVPGGRDRLARDLRRLAREIAALGGRSVALSYSVVDDEEMAGLHETYSGVPGPTDVLSFPLAEEPLVMGEIVVSAETARREAGARGHSAYDELVLYAVHGSLHLVGYDDHDPRDRRRMRAAERKVLHALGIEPVFAQRRVSK